MADVYNSKIAQLIGKLKNQENGKYAITISSTCTLYSVDEATVLADVPWQKHEAEHKRQIATLGWWRFMSDYLCYGAAYQYKEIPYEEEALTVEKKAREADK